MTYSKEKQTLNNFINFSMKGTREEREKMGAIFTCQLV